MNKTIICFCLIVIALHSCNNIKDDVSEDEFIRKIENNLLPKIIIEGEEITGFNIEERMAHHNVPGLSIAFLDKGEIQWARCYGYADVEKQREVNKNTLFQAASISKPIAAMAALSLVEEGEIGLDEDVNQYLKGWQLENNNFTSEEKVTLRRILSHSAGLTVHGFGGYSKTDTLPDIIQVLNGEGTANSGKIFPDVTPGTIYRYSGGGYTIMQKILCDISGKEFPDLMDKLVLSKIGMTSSTYLQPLPEEKQGEEAYAYKRDGSPLEGGWHIYPEMAAAGLWTTPVDLLKYAIEVYNSYNGKPGGILSKDMTQQMLTPQINSHGLGPGLNGEGESISFGHGGANAGYRCQLFVFTLTGQGVAIMTNSDNGGSLNTEILRSFAKVLDWPRYQPLTKSVLNLSKEELEEFAGNYVLKLGDQDLVLELTSGENCLKAYQVWDDFSFELYADDVDKFFGRHDGVPFEFSRNEDGNIHGITVYEGSNEYHLLRLEQN